jgi:hypothetical protein
MTAGRRTKASSGWRRCPPDGTNYAYWKHEAGWLIETKPRFRPGIPYTLYAAKSVIGCDPWPITFTTLKEAKDAARWPRESLLDSMRASCLNYLSAFVGSDEDRIVARLMDMAREEDDERRRRPK